ncbi:hypothetical protein ACVI1K_005033 [Bradyrhizobium sp. USDA 4508]
MKKFSVTFERWTHEDVEHGDTDKRGFVIEDVSLREAIQLGLEYREPSWAGACEANDSRTDSVRWLTFYKWNDCTRDNLETGTIEDRSLHIPDHITPASRRRICRMFGIETRR